MYLYLSNVFFPSLTCSDMEHDSKQVLFRRCGYEAVKDGLACERVVIDINEYTRCNYHSNMHDCPYVNIRVSFIYCLTMFHYMDDYANPNMQFLRNGFPCLISPP